MAQANYCLVFADVAGSSRLYEALGDVSALRAVDQCMVTVIAAAAPYQGRLIKTIGDEAMLAFARPEQGLLAACEIQQRIDALPPVDGMRLAVRVGAHFGSVIEEGGDVFGDTVNIAARLTDLAKAGQVLVSAETLAAVPALLRPPSRSLDAVAVKGKRDPVSVVELLWCAGADADLTLMPDRAIDPSRPSRQLLLRHRGRELMLDGSRSRVVLGRDPACDLVIEDARASRSHARIELRQENFVLVDQSTNGTWVAAEGQEGYMVRREETILRGSGRLCFGHAWRPEIEAVEFRVAG